MKNIYFFIITILLLSCAPEKHTEGEKVELLSPDGKLRVEVEIGEKISYTVQHEKCLVIYPSTVSMKLETGTIGVRPILEGAKRQSVDTVITSPFYKRSSIKDCYHELTLTFKGNYKLVFRAYNEGMAYRFIVDEKKDFLVLDEEANFNLGYDSKAFIPYVRSEAETYEKQFVNSFENIYAYESVQEWKKTKLAFSPVVVDRNQGKRIAIGEADLNSYPGMFLHNPDQSVHLKGIFAPCPAKEEQNLYNPVQMLVSEYENYIARCNATTVFPWRMIIVAQNDKELADNDLVYKLAVPSQIADTRWIKPGKVAWEWWNDSNLYGVDFKTGINNATYKYYIDFASENEIAYVLLDEGWTVSGSNDLFNVVPEIDLKELIGYAGQKNIGLILWAGYIGFNKDIENVCRHYSEMGIKGFKIDFMDRDDQAMVDFHYRVAQTAAKYKLIIDFHGTHKPAGLNRTYPNVLNFEAVHGLEQLKFPTSVNQVVYDVTAPFIRQLAGPMDYTQGAMRNATQKNFRSVYGEPMSQGTRCRQLAAYVVFESPLSMLCDSPSNYAKEKECTGFISSVPTVWDNTLVMDGQVGAYIAIARQKGNDWYIGALTNWEARTLDLDLSFLGTGDYVAEVFRDGINADKAACDYKKEILPIRADKKLKIAMAPGGGCAIRMEKRN
jgi:alpha-glucosidase